MTAIAMMSQLGNPVESYIIAEWMIAESDAVSTDRTLASTGTDESITKMLSTVENTILKLLWEEGDEVLVKNLFIIVGGPGRDTSGLVPGGGATPAEADAPAEQVAATSRAGTPTFATERAIDAVSPCTRAPAASDGVDASAITEGSGPRGHVTERDAVATVVAGPVLTPTARAVGMSIVEGTDIGGCASIADIGRAAEAAPATAVAALTAATADSLGAPTLILLKDVHRAVAKRMMESPTSAVQLTLNMAANTVDILAMRKKVRSADEALGLNKITPNDLVCFVVSRTLLKYPVFNAHLEDGVLIESEQIHLGFACDIPRGLLTPVVRSAQAPGLKAFPDEAKRLVGGVIDSSLLPDLLNGGTFTASNIGPLGIETFIPVISPS